MFFGNVYKQIDKVKVVSFDIFDTLLLRPYLNPSDLFKHIGKIHSLPNYYQERIEAETIFYNKNGGSKEASIDDIYSVIPQYKDIKQIELDMEYQVLSANQEMLKIYNYALEKGKIVVIASDMYLPYKFIEKVLHKNNICNYYKLYLSNEINKRKDRGDMYDYIINDLKVKPKDILHIGDNKKADYKQALKRGLNSFLYKNINHKFLKKNKHFNILYKQDANLLGLSILLSIIAQKNNESDYWIDFGFKYAGIVAFSYAKMIYDIAKTENLKEILFVARDGYLLEKVFNLLNKTKEINTHYVYAPRILNYTSNLDFDSNLKEQPRIICEYFKQDTKGKQCNQYIQEHIDLFRELAAKEKIEADYKNYIINLVSNEKHIGVVDTISGQLSAQKLIANEAELQTTGFYFLTLAGRAIVNELCHYDFLCNEQRDKFTEKGKCDLIELIFSAPENPIITIKKGKPIYKTNITIEEKNRHEIYKKIEQGVLTFTNEIINRFNNDVIFERQIILDLLQIYVDNPSQKDIKAMYSVKKSPYADNSLYVPLFSADIPFWQLKKYKKLIWHSPMQHFFAVISKPLSIRIRLFKHFKITFFPLLKTNFFKCSIMDNIGFYIGGGSNV